MWRSNWSVVDSPELLQRGSVDTLPEEKHAGEQRDSQHINQRASLQTNQRGYLRIERQTLRRLPETGAVVFTIRVMINPLEDLLLREGAVAALQAAVKRMSPEEGRYKSLAPLLSSADGPLRRFFSQYGKPLSD